MCTDINHNYGVSTNGIPPMLAVPLAGSVKIAIKDLNGKIVGETTATSQGEWRQTFCLDDGTYVVEFTGAFRPIGIGFSSVYNKPVTSTSITIAVPLTESVDLVPPAVIIGPPGPAGVAGVKGETGPSGIAGIAGVEGPSGPSGPSGEEGAQGIAGTDGPQGNSGPQGSQGVVGPDGPPGTTVHRELTGLTIDDHNQYALLTGRSSGQTLIGGTGSGDDLVLSSTSDATKGTIDIATSTDTVGIGVAPENRKLEIQDDTNPNAISGSNVDVSELITTFHRANDTNNVAIGIGFSITSARTSVGAAIIHERVTAHSKGKLHFATKPTIVEGDDIPIRMTIDEDGRVGIGVTSPNSLANLDVGSGVGVIYYVPTTSGDWAGDGPDGVFEALDELAARNATLPLILTAAGGMGTVTDGAGDVNNLPQRAETSYWGVNYHYLAFATNESAFWNVVMPNNWDGGTMVATFYWTAPSGSDDVKFEIKAGSFANGDALDESLGTEVSVEDTLIANDDVHITSTTSAMTLSGAPAAGEYCIFQVERVVPEGYDLDGDVHLLSVRLEYAATG